MNLPCRGIMRGLVFLVLGLSWSVRGGSEEPAGRAKHAVFLLDTSMSEYPSRYRANVDRLRKTLETDKSIEQFNVLTFDITGRWLERKGWLKNAAGERARAQKVLENMLVEGATDIAAALEALARPPFPIAKNTPLRVFVLSDGNITWGESDPRSMQERFQVRCPFPVSFTVDVADKSGDALTLLKALAAFPGASRPPAAPARAAFLRFVDKVNPQVKLLEGKNAEHVKLLLKMLDEDDYEWPPLPESAGLRLHSDANKDYLKAREDDRYQIGIYLNEAKRRGDAGDAQGMVRALSTLAEIVPGNADVLRAAGYRLLDRKQPAFAVRLFERVQEQRPFEPHSYRDLARSLEDAGKYGLAAVQYEIVQAGTWNAKFTTSLKEVVLEEYAHMMRDAIRRKAVGNKLINLFGERLEGVEANKLQADLRVTISWNTDNTDVDLWVIEPDGEKCFYAHRQTKNGGELTQDVTQGYGPERYQMIKAKAGEFSIKVHYYSGPRNPQTGETSVNVVVRRNAGTPQEVSQRHTVILRQRNDLVEVCRMKF
jgi:hypothetical protein